MTKQVRFIGSDTCGLQVRETEGQQGSRVIAGRPIVFGVRSHNLTPWSSTRVVYEILEPGCISREVLQKSDVILNLNHNSNVVNVLGRYPIMPLMYGCPAAAMPEQEADLKERSVDLLKFD